MCECVECVERMSECGIWGVCESGCVSKVNQ